MNAAQCLLAGGDDASLAVAGVGERWRRGALREAVARAARTWHGLGLSRGERVAVKLVDGADWIIAYLGAIWAGGVAVGVNPRLPSDEWQAMLDEAGFRFLLADTIDDDATARGATTVAIAAWQRELQRATPVDPLPMDDGEPALWVHSSGTSGRPKAVVHAHRFALEVERVGRERLGIGARDRLLASSKLFFTYPLANSVFTGLKAGATVLLDRRWPSAADVVATAMAERASVVFSVPSLYRDMLKLGLASALAHAGVRVFVSAGEALSPALRAQWQERTGATIVDGFGTSETLVLALVDCGDGRALQASPGFTVTSLDGNGAPGRLLIRGPSLALGYWRRPDADASHFRDDGFASSDLFETAADGWRFAGRDDSLVKVHGRWVDLNALEQGIALACPGMREAAAVAVADDDGVDAVALFFVAAADVDVPDETTLRAHAGRLPAYQRPRWLHRIDSLPRTGTGKLLRRRLRELHRELVASAMGEPRSAQRTSASSTSATGASP
nr:AMP-binding protein [Caldimonas sp.]